MEDNNQLINKRNFKRCLILNIIAGVFTIIAIYSVITQFVCVADLKHLQDTAEGFEGLGGIGIAIVYVAFLFVLFPFFLYRFYLSNGVAAR